MKVNFCVSSNSLRNKKKIIENYNFLKPNTMKIRSKQKRMVTT